MFINNQRGGNRPELIEFTRRDPALASQITNQKIAASSVECSTSPFNNEFMVCAFADDLGTRKEISNIVFTNFNVTKPEFTSFKQADSGEIVTKVSFKGGAVCDIMGHNSIGLTLSCKDSNVVSSPKEDSIRNRNMNPNGGNWS